MVNHCAVGGCNNRHGRDTSSRRSFLVFHAVPRDAKRRKAWDKRVNRADHDIRRLKTYRVCSDHFSDSDYQKEDWEHYEKTGFQTQIDQDTRVLSLSELMMDIFCHELNKSLFVSRKTIYNLRLV